MRELFECVQKRMDAGEDSVIAIRLHKSDADKIIISSHMLIGLEGCIWGMLNNSVIENSVEAYAIEHFHGRGKNVKDFVYADKNNEQEYTTEFCFHYASADSIQEREMINRALQLMNGGEEGWIAINLQTSEIAVVDCFGISCGAVFPEEICRAFPKKSCYRIVDQNEYYVLSILRRKKVYIFGGGEIARSLLKILNQMNFRCIIVDNNVQYANWNRFVDAYSVRLVDYYRMENEILMEEDDYAVVLTRGFLYDEKVEAYLLKSSVKNIIAVRDKNKKTYEEHWLFERGYSKEQVEKINHIWVNEYEWIAPCEIAVRIAALILDR